MHIQTPRADVCTTKRTRRAQQPKLPYPDRLPASAPAAEFWTVTVARTEAELAAFRTFAGKTFKNKDLAWCDTPLARALTSAEIDLEKRLQSEKGHLARALERAEVPA